MIISHDRQTLFIGVPKNGSQTARAALGQFGIDLVGAMGRHPTVPEAIRLAEARFPGEVIAPTAIYAFWRDPVERFCSAMEFHKRCFPNSFLQLFPERFVGVGPHPRWFEPDPRTVRDELRSLIDSISALDILAALPPPPVLGRRYKAPGDNLSFYQPQSVWLKDSGVTTLAFVDLTSKLDELIECFGGLSSENVIPWLNWTPGTIELEESERQIVEAHYACDIL